MESMEYCTPYYAETDSDAQISVEVGLGECAGKVTGRWISMRVEEDGKEVWAHFSPKQARELAYLLCFAAHTVVIDNSNDLIAENKDE